MIARLFEHPASLLLLVVLLVVLFSYKKLPEMARSLGRSTRILKSEIDEMKEESSQRNHPISDKKTNGETFPQNSSSSTAAKNYRTEDETNLL